MEADAAESSQSHADLESPIDRSRRRYHVRLGEADLPESVRVALVTLIDAVAEPTVEDVTTILLHDLSEE
jgi:hypothetical protein